MSTVLDEYLYSLAIIVSLDMIEEAPNDMLEYFRKECKILAKIEIKEAEA